MSMKRGAGCPTKSGMREFEKVAAKQWDEGVSLDELLVRVNRVASKLLPAEAGRDSRVSPTVLPRTFRHYTTLGCIDHGRRDGRRVVYGYRQFLQALLVRRLLWDRVPSGQIAVMMAGRGTEETERMFLGGIEMVAKADGEQSGSASALPAPATVEAWTRVRMAPGVELHLRHDIAKLRGAALKDLLERLEIVLRQNL
jgi:DNA-binding transcriptional MerR regulator